MQAVTVSCLSQHLISSCPDDKDKSFTYLKNNVIAQHCKYKTVSTLQIFSKLPRPGDSEESFRFPGQADT